MKIECGEAAEYLGHGSASSASAKTHAPKLRMPCKTLRVTLAAVSAGICENVVVNESSRIVRYAD
ncbi:hypothetical protein D3C87_2034020 [compost metagenome]